MAFAEPAEQLGVARAGPQHLVLAVPVDLLLVTMRHVAGGPAVYVAGVPKQLPHFPQRAAGDRGVEPGQLGCRRKQGAGGVQRRDVLVRFPRDIMPARARPPLEDPCSVIATGLLPMTCRRAAGTGPTASIRGRLAPCQRATPRCSS